MDAARVAIYIRVSTEEQVREGYSIAAQRDRLLAFCRAQGWDAVDIYTDEGLSGASLERPQLRRLRADVKAGRVNLVLVWKVDRLSRKVAHLAGLVDEFDQAGAALRSATEPFDTSHAAGRAFLHMLSTFAELERETIRERVKLGIRQRVKEGHIHGRPTPYGYRRIEKGVWEIVPEEAEIIRLIYRRYREGAGVVRIAQELAAMDGVRVPATEHDGRHYDRQTSLHDRVRWMLHNPVYAGYAPLGRELYSGRHPAIIPAEEWHEVQRIWESERAVPNRAKRSAYPLTGLIVCGECGRNMTGFRQPNRARDPAAKARRPYYEYYVCLGSSQVRGRTHPCPNWGLARDRAEEAVIQTIAGLALDNGKLAAGLKKASRTHPKDSPAAEHARLERRLAQIRQRRRKWFLEFERGDGLEEEARQRLRELADEERAVAAQLEALDQEDRRRPQVGRAEVLELAGNIRAIAEAASREELKRLFRIFVRRVRVSREKQVEIDVYPF